MSQEMSFIGFETCFGRSKGTIPGNLSETDNCQISNFGISVFQATGQPAESFRRPCAPKSPDDTSSSRHGRNSQQQFQIGNRHRILEMIYCSAQNGFVETARIDGLQFKMVAVSKREVKATVEEPTESMLAPKAQKR
jgi:hypothetical protein